MNRITIITVTFNCVKTIERTIKSVLSQSYKNIEFIIIDGASTDGTLDIIKRYSKDLSYWESKPDRGIYHAMNKALERATGDIINFQGGDDFLHDQFVCENISKEFMESESDLLFGLCDYSGQRTVSFHYESIDELLLGTASHQALFTQKKVFDEIGGFDETYKVVADYEWLLRVFESGKRIHSFPLLVSDYSLGGISSGIVNVKELFMVRIEYARKLKKYYLIPQIIATFHAMLRDRIFDEVINKTVDAKSCIYNVFSHTGGKCSVWGLGKQGMECVNTLKKIGIEIAEIIDSDTAKQGKNYSNVRIEAYKEDKNYELIIITPVRSEEIKRILSIRGLRHKEDYITWQELKSEIVNYGMREKYCGINFMELLEAECECIKLF